MQTGYAIRPATPDDIPALETLIALSARELSGGDYTQAQIESAVRHIFGVDSELVADGTYFAVTAPDGDFAACGGWSRRKTLFGGDRYAGRESGLLDPTTDAAKIRAFFVHPAHARQGIGKMLLAHCESAARKEGFRHAEMMATLPGVKLYSALGYEKGELQHFTQPDEVEVPFIPMYKQLSE